MNLTNEKLFKILKDNLIYILACGILFFGVAFAYSRFYVKPEYFSEAKIKIEPEKQTDLTTTAGITAARMLADSYIAILNSENFYTLVHNSLPENLRSNYTVNQLQESASMEVLGNTEVIVIKYTCLNDKDAQDITTAIISNIEGFFSKSSYAQKVWITEDAKKPKISEDRTIVYSVAGFIAGMLLVFLIAVMKEALDVRVKTAKDLVERYDLPVLGSIPAFKGKVIKKEDV